MRPSATAPGQWLFWLLKKMTKAAPKILTNFHLKRRQVKTFKLRLWLRLRWHTPFSPTCTIGRVILIKSHQNNLAQFNGTGDLTKKTNRKQWMVLKILTIQMSARALSFFSMSFFLEKIVIKPSIGKWLRITHTRWPSGKTTPATITWTCYTDLV